MILLTLYLVSRAHEDLLQVVLAAYFHLEVEWTLDYRVLSLTTGCQHLLGYRVVPILKLINSPVFDDSFGCSFHLSSARLCLLCSRHAVQLINPVLVLS